tara:strand:+ start:1033 stop:1140 length:108 start_codon:yes stop_codon:yes gene_type:complete
LEFSEADVHDIAKSGSGEALEDDEFVDAVEKFGSV